MNSVNKFSKIEMIEEENLGNKLLDILRSGKIEESPKNINLYKKVENFLVNMCNIMSSSKKKLKFLKVYKKKLDEKVKLKNLQLNEMQNDQETRADLMKDLKMFFDLSKNHYISINQKYLNEKENFKILEETLKIKKEKRKNKEKLIKDDFKPEETMILKKINIYKKEKNKYEPKIEKMRLSLKEKENEKREIIKKNKELEKIIFDENTNLNNLDLVPNRKIKDLRIFEENLENLKKNIEKANNKKEDQKRKINNILKKINNSKNFYNKEKKLKLKMKTLVETNTKRLNDLNTNNKKYKIEEITLLENKKIFENELKDIEKRIRLLKSFNFHIQNQLLSDKRKYKLNQKNLEKFKNNIQKVKNSIDTLMRKKIELNKEIYNLQKKIEVIYDVEKINVIHYDDLEDKTNKEKLAINKFQEKFIFLENEFKGLKDLEQKCFENLKKEVELKEILGKKVLLTLNDQNSLNESLAIKELIILDEKKKIVEFEKNLNRFKKLYEGVKAERNNYVNLIQITSQDRSELKENFKCLDREMALLKTRLIEKKKIHQNIFISIQNSTKDRDKKKNKLNIYDGKKIKVENHYNCLANEIDKLTVIVKMLDSNVLEICKQNDNICLKRNILGHNLMEINKDICHFYDEYGIENFENHKLKRKIFYIEKSLNMNIIQIKHFELQNKLYLNKIKNLPHLANTILKMEKRIKKLKREENKNSEKLENLEIRELTRELKGEDPSENVLKTKLEYLEELLNQKKEKFLEREIVFEELSKGVDHLKNNSIKQRHKNLTIVNKSNICKNKINKISKKIMMIVSELSIFQAIEVKLNFEKTEKEKFMDTIRDRIFKGEPPKQDSEFKFLKSIRDEVNFYELNQKRKNQNFVNKFVKPFFIKTTSKKRVDAYINKIGLPRPYFKNGPFIPNNFMTKLQEKKQERINNFMR